MTKDYLKDLLKSIKNPHDPWGSVDERREDSQLALLKYIFELDKDKEIVSLFKAINNIDDKLYWE